MTALSGVSTKVWNARGMPGTDHLAPARTRRVFVHRDRPAHAEGGGHVHHAVVRGVEVRMRRHDGAVQGVARIAHRAFGGERGLVDDELAVAFGHGHQVRTDARDVDVVVVGDPRHRFEHPLPQGPCGGRAEAAEPGLAVPGIARRFRLQQPRAEVDARFADTKGIHHAQAVEPVPGVPAGGVEHGGTGAHDGAAQPCRNVAVDLGRDGGVARARAAKRRQGFDGGRVRQHGGHDDPFLRLNACAAKIFVQRCRSCSGSPGSVDNAKAPVAASARRHDDRDEGRPGAVV